MKRTGGGCGGCGCGCFMGCIGLILVVAGALFALYWFGIRNGAFVEHLDGAVEWAYKNEIRPMLIDKIGRNMTPEQQQQLLQVSDTAVEKYLAMPPEEKRAILNEAGTAYYYMQLGEMVPPEKIPHLKKFIDDLQQQNLPSAPRHNWQSPTPVKPPEPAPPQDSPRLLN